MAGTDTYYWDTCLFLAWLRNESPPSRQEDEMDGVRYYIRSVEDRKIRIMTSAITFVETTATKLPAGADEQFSDLLRRSSVSVVAADIKICRLARTLRDYYSDRASEFNNKTLSVPDAIHLATAILYKGKEFHTFDANNSKRSLGLLPLSGNVGGHNLVICKPEARQRELGLETQS